MNDSTTPTPRARAPLILAFLIGGGVLLGLGLFANRQQKAPPAARSAPAITLLSPQPNDTVASPLVVRFRTPAPLALGPHGWMAATFHPHMFIDGREHMAGANDIRPAGANEFEWTLPVTGPGPHWLVLTWADGNHRLAADTVGQAISFQLR